VRKLALDVAKQEKPFHTFDRVSPDFLVRVDACVRAFIRIEIKRLPSKGKTIR
jgi:hypothetical protein